MTTPGSRSGAAGPHPLRATAAEAVLVGSPLEDEVIAAAAARRAPPECRPFDDGVASEWYRRRMVELFVRRALENLARPGGEGG